MSRNLGHKRDSKAPQKTIKGRAPNSDDSSDDDYTGVDLITDSEEDEPDVEVAEEQAIIESEEDEDDAIPSASQPNTEDDQSSWAGFDLEDDDQLMGDVPFFDEHMARMSAPDLDIEASAWAATSDDAYSSSRRSSRVRFDLSDSTSTVSDDDTIFPDIFLDQNSLDPTFRRAIENDNDNDDEPGASSDDGSYWDFRGSEGRGGEESGGEVDDNKSESSYGSSGYESMSLSIQDMMVFPC